MSDRLSDRLSDERVQWFIDHMPEQGSGALAREVQELRAVLDKAMGFAHVEALFNGGASEGNLVAGFLSWKRTADRANKRHDAIDTLCDRHDITVEGIVALVENMFQPAHPDDDPMVTEYVEYARRLARGEDA